MERKHVNTSSPSSSYLGAHGGIKFVSPEGRIGRIRQQM
jgi:hypothetical protein